MGTHTARDIRTAPCPLCSKERNDKRLKTLYAIYGFQNGQYDEDIPKVWFDVPPVKLDSSEPGMEALRVSLHSANCFWELTVIVSISQPHSLRDNDWEKGSRIRDKKCDLVGELLFSGEKVRVVKAKSLWSKEPNIRVGEIRKGADAMEVKRKNDCAPLEGSEECSKVFLFPFIDKIVKRY